MQKMNKPFVTFPHIHRQHDEEEEGEEEEEMKKKKKKKKKKNMPRFEPGLRKPTKVKNNKRKKLFFPYEREYFW